MKVSKTSLKKHKVIEKKGPLFEQMVYYNELILSEPMNHKHYEKLSAILLKLGDIE